MPLNDCFGRNQLQNFPHVLPNNMERIPAFRARSLFLGKRVLNNFYRKVFRQLFLALRRFLPVMYLNLADLWLRCLFVGVCFHFVEQAQLVILALLTGAAKLPAPSQTHLRHEEIDPLLQIGVLLQ